MTQTLNGQVGIVTGAGRGIGREIASGLAALGMALGVHARTREQVEETAHLIEMAGGVAVPVTGDITDPEQVDALHTVVQHNFGAVDLLVNNAGMTDSSEQPLWETNQTEWWRVVEVNLRGPVLACSAVLPSMISRRHGRIVNVSTLSASRSDAFYSGYAAAKAGLMRVTDSLATALNDNGTGVFVFDISPGLVRTEMTRQMNVWSDVSDEGWTPVARMVELVVAVAQGRADPLHGRFIHASDDLSHLVETAACGFGPDSRKLRIQKYASADPLPT